MSPNFMHVSLEPRIVDKGAVSCYNMSASMHNYRHFVTYLDKDMGTSASDRALKTIKEMGILRPRDLDRHGIPREYLRRLTRQGLVKQVGRGLYMLPDTEIDEHHSLAEIAKRVPHGVICLLSALRFHEMTTQAPFEVWVAIDSKAHLPRNHGVPVRVVRFSGQVLREGITTHTIEGVDVPIYSPAKTVADCFRYRNKVGLDVAIEALRDCRRQQKCNYDELWHYAIVCRVAQVMKPYLEVMV